MLAEALLCPAAKAKAREELTVPRGGSAASPNPAQELLRAGFWGGLCSAAAAEKVHLVR